MPEQARDHVILVTGVNGQVGFELLRTLQGLGRVVAADRAMLDLGSSDAIRRCIREVRPTMIVNPAAYTAVDQAETEVAAARQINADAPATLAEEAKRVGALLVHYSTDYVFDGMLDRPYREDDLTHPCSGYGATKLEGEQAIRASGCAHLIFRTSWVYGLRGKNFLLTMLKLAEQRSELRVVADQFGAPTWAVTLAALTSHVLAQGASAAEAWPEWAERVSGTYHLSATGSTSWAGFAEAIFAHANLPSPPRVTPISTAEYPVPAIRPANSRLDCAKFAATFGLVPPNWREALELCLGQAR
ncbi:dTDP-4-dehydrorhamnose reductase [Paraburkholderia sp. J63]|uniref:dTDP-4-dehydrorhamnose reductase n=1 Tax=Paraburkholderia sp. J63 TaxID=2805434 RepID=UPI002ABDD7C8|nr:dTDP-4-dehydrorhamnose reductase [Paraburkholderia sp. J63]